MLHIHVGWDKHLFGACNRYQGEYDACQYSVLVVGIPVYFSFKGCFHVIHGPKLKPEERRERLREFVQTFLGLTELAKQTLLPLKPVPELKRRWFYEYFLWILGLTFVPGVSFVLLGVLANPVRDEKKLLVAVLVGSIIAAYLSCLILFLARRKPSRRQARIRGVVASRLGPFSDPADWATELVARVASAFGIASLTPEELLRTAERLLKQEHHPDALIVARMALALLSPALDLVLADRAESITEDCLRSLDLSERELDAVS